MKSDVARVVFIVFAVLYQPCPQVYADFVANSASDSTLASKFAPVLVLTKNPTRPGREVLRPEPVEIMGAESLWNVYFSVWSADGNSLSQNGRTPVQWRELENLLGSQGFANVNFADNKFAYLGMDSPTELDGEWVSPHFFDYPGEDKESWNREYKSGLKAGKNFPNTVYARVFTRDAADDHGSVIIKYFCFYPYNDFTNDHEGDWAKINVKVTSRNPQEAEVYGVDFKFHGNSLVYDRDEITTNPSMVNFRNYISIVGNANPVIYVGAGSHANLPRPGIYTRPGGAENLTPHGIVLHPTISRPIQNIAESYKLVMLPDPFSNVNNSGQALVDNMGLEPEMSWLGADLLWGTPMVDSPGANFESLGCVRLFGSERLKYCVDAHNDAPRGPFYTGWSKIKTRDKDWSKDNVPDGEFHHFPVVDAVTWSGTPESVKSRA